MRNASLLVLFVFALSAAMLSGCSKKVDRAALEREIRAADEDFSRRSEAVGAAQAFREFLADSSVQLPVIGPPRRGRDNIYNEMLKEQGVILTWAPEKAEVSTSGDMGFTWGRYTVRVPMLDEAGQPMVITGKYMNVWRKTADGWKVVADMGNQEPRRAASASATP